MNQDARKNETRIGWAFHAAGGIALAIAVWAFYVIVYQPLIDERGRLDVRIEQINTLLGKSADVQRRHRLVREQLDELEESVASLEGRLPSELGGEKFERQVRRLAAATGLEIVGVQHRLPQSKATHDQAEIGFELRGGFESTCRLIAEIGQLARITKISMLELDSDPDSGSNQVQIRFVLYYGVESDDGDKKGAVL